MTAISSRPPSPPHRPERLLGLVLPLLLLVAGCPQPAELPEEKPAAAQKPEAVDERPPYPVVQDPETNGYHELLLAAAEVRKIEGHRWMGQGDRRLPEMRKGVSHPSAVTALVHLRKALRKPIRYPSERLQFNSRFPELVDFRSITRLLTEEYRVAVADGDWRGAADSFRTAVEFASAAPVVGSVQHLVQSALLRLPAAAVAREIKRLPADHCRELIRICELCPVDKEFTRRALLGDLQMALGGMADPAGEMDEARWKSLFTRSSYDEVAGYLESHREEWLGMIDLPPADRVPLAVPSTMSRGATQMVSDFVSPLVPITETHELNLAVHRLLQTHLRLRLYYLDAGVYPAQLSELDAGELTVDPFTGKTLAYARTAGGYSLTSVGRLHDSEGKLESKERKPIDLTKWKPTPKDQK